MFLCQGYVIVESIQIIIYSEFDATFVHSYLNPTDMYAITSNLDLQFVKELDVSNA
jgi:uncharacterized protein (DUF1919 family)